MKSISGKTIKLASGSSIILSIISIMAAIGILYALATLLAADAWAAWTTWFVLLVLGISTYYFAFSVLSWLYVRKKGAAKT